MKFSMDFSFPKFVILFPTILSTLILLQLLLLLPRRYSPMWALASFTTNLHCSLLLIFFFHPFTFIFFKSPSTSSSHISLGFPFHGITLCSSLLTCPNHLIICDLIKLTIPSPFSNVFISSLCLILHILFSITGPYILRIIFLSNILYMFSSVAVEVHVSAPYVTTGLINVYILVV
jgi:hypothetical protein